MEHSKHIWRAAFLLVFILVGVVVGRHFLIPPSFGQAGYYRYDALFEHMAKEPVHGAPDACADCHDDIAAAKASGKHAPVKCEVCHDTLASHVKDGDKFANMRINRSWELCAYCHQKLPGRPALVAQVDLLEHLELSPGQPIPAEACVQCHDANMIHHP
jgi:hypothetical protein